jgi:hypothetical protein
MNASGRSHLAFEFRYCGLEYSYERAWTKLFGDGSDVLKPLSLAEGANKSSTLRTHSTNCAPLGKDHSPRKNAGCHKDEQHGLRYRTGLKDEINYFATDEQQEDGRKMHHYRENP